MWQRDQFQTPCLLKKLTKSNVKAFGLEIVFNIFRQSSNYHTIKTNRIKFKTIYLQIYSISIFQKRVWEQFLYHIFFMIFQQKCFSCYVLMTNQISKSNCVYFLRYQAICVLQLFVNHSVTSQISKLTLSFESSRFY